MNDANDDDKDENDGDGGAKHGDVKDDNGAMHNPDEF